VVAETVNCTQTEKVEAPLVEKTTLERRGRPKRVNLALTGNLVNLLQRMFPNHVSFTSEERVTQLHRELLDCIKLAGSVDRLVQILLFLDDDSTEHGRSVLAATAASSDRLGAYIWACMKKDWLAKFDESTTGTTKFSVLRS
jgi:hypothetical protein